MEKLRIADSLSKFDFVSSHIHDNRQEIFGESESFSDSVKLKTNNVPDALNQFRTHLFELEALHGRLDFLMKDISSVFKAKARS